MAKIHGKDADVSINAVAVEDDGNEVTLDIAVDTPEITSFSDAAKEFLEGVYGWTMTYRGFFEPTSGKNDATIFAMLGAGAKTVSVTPGGGAASADNPEYTGSAFLTSYSVRTPRDGPVEVTAVFTGHGALTRAVA
jgi:hypothetical protein